MSAFRIALSGDFNKSDGSPAYPMFDLSPLENAADIEVAYVDPVDGRMTAASLAAFDALILLTLSFKIWVIPSNATFTKMPTITRKKKHAFRRVANVK